MRLRAAMVWDPDAVVVGRTAAAAQFWPGLPTLATDLAVTGHHWQRSAPGFRLTKRRIPPDWVSHGPVRYTAPALTAVDLCLELGDEVIERALRSRRATPALLRDALQAAPYRAGNRLRRQAILDSAGNPWSYAERLGQRRLREAGIRGWRGNPKLLIAGKVYYPDIAFDEARLVAEIDGYAYHGDPSAFQRDRTRHNEFVLAGWTVLQFTVDDVERTDGWFAAHIRRALRMLRP